MTMTTRRIGLVALVAALLLTLVWYVALFRPQSARLKAAHQAYSKAEQQAQTLRVKVTALEALQKQIPADTAALKQLDTAIPTSPDLRDVLNQLHSIASTDGVELTTFTPTQPSASSGGSSSSKSSGGPSPLNISMALSGPYQGMMSFITSLDSMPRTVVVDGVTINAGPSGKLTANLTARAFYAP